MANELCLDQRTQKRNKLEDIPPFICYDGENVFKKKSISVRCWSGLGIILYAGAGHIQIRGMSEPMDQQTMLAFDACIKRAFQYLYPDGIEE